MILTSVLCLWVKNVVTTLGYPTTVVQWGVEDDEPVGSQIVLSGGVSNGSHTSGVFRRTSYQLTVIGPQGDEEWPERVAGQLFDYLEAQRGIRIDGHYVLQIQSDGPYPATTDVGEDRYRYEAIYVFDVSRERV